MPLDWILHLKGVYTILSQASAARLNTSSKRGTYLWTQASAIRLIRSSKRGIYVVAHTTWHPLPRATTTTSCSSSSLLVTNFTQHLASHPTSAPLLTTSSPLPSPLAATSHQGQKRLMPLLALLLVFIRDAFITTYTLLPSHLSKNSHHEYFKALSYTSDHPKNSEEFLLQK